MALSKAEIDKCGLCSKETAVCEQWSAQVELKQMVCLDIWLPYEEKWICENCAQSLLEQAMEKVLDAALEKES